MARHRGHDYSSHNHRHADDYDESGWLDGTGGTGGPPAHHYGQGAGGRGGAPLSFLEDMMKKKGIDEAWNALEDMHRQGVTTDRFTISRMLMKTVGDGRARWNPSKVYRGISLVEGFIKIQPEEADEVLFNALLDTCCRMKDLGRLEATVNRMRELKVLPSHVTLGILVKAYGQAGDIQKVLNVWDDMADQRRQANAVTFGCMIDACVKCGNMDKAIDIFEDMKKRKKHRNTILYTTLIKGYGMEKNMKNALALFKEMSDEGVPYNTITYNSIIDVCIKCSNIENAEGLLREMISAGNNLAPDLITYSTLLKGYCHLGELDRALQVAETIKVCGLKCDELVYNTLMDGCVKANDLSAGIGLFAEMTQAGMKPSSITHSILVRLYQRNGYKGDAADAVAQLYQHHGMDRPNASNERGSRGRRGGNKHDKGGYSGGGHHEKGGGKGRDFADADASGRDFAGHAAPRGGPHMRSAMPPGPIGPQSPQGAGCGGGSYPSQPGGAGYDAARDYGPRYHDPYAYEAMRGMLPGGGMPYPPNMAGGPPAHRDFPGQGGMHSNGLYAMPPPHQMPFAGRGAPQQSPWFQGAGGHMGDYGLEHPDRYGGDAAYGRRRPSYDGMHAGPQAAPWEMAYGAHAGMPCGSPPNEY